MRLETALYGSAVLLDRLLGLLLLPLLAGALAQGDYGAWSQSMVAVGVLLPLVLFALPTAIVRSFSGRVGAALRLRVFGELGAVVVGLLGLCTLLVLLAGGRAGTLIFGAPERAGLLPALLMILASEAASEFAIAWQRALGRIGTVAGWMMLRSLLRYALLWLLAGPGGRPLVYWLGRYAAVQLLLALLMLGGTAWQLSRRVDAPQAAPPPRLQALLAFSAPLVLLALFTALNATLDRFLLVHVLGLDGVAVYAAAVSLCSVPAALYGVLGFTLFPVLARHWHEGRAAEAARLTTLALQTYLFLCLPLALLLALAGPRLLPLLTTAQYQAAPAVFGWLGLSVTAFGLYQIILYALLLDGRSHQVLLLAVAAAGANAGLNLLLAPRLGAVGAAAAAAASNGLMVTVAARLARRAMPWQFPWARLWPIAWRAALATLPLLFASPSWPAFIALLALSAALYFGLDLARAGSVTRALIAR